MCGACELKSWEKCSMREGEGRERETTASIYYLLCHSHFHALDTSTNVFKPCMAHVYYFCLFSLNLVVDSVYRSEPRLQVVGLLRSASSQRPQRIRHQQAVCFYGSHSPSKFRIIVFVRGKACRSSCADPASAGEKAQLADE